MKLPKDLREFIELLNSKGVRYVIVGGYAVAYHGHPRFTGDIDLYVEPSADNAARILAVLHAFGFGELELSAQDFTNPDSIVQLGRPPNRIDLLTSISGVPFENVWQGRVFSQLDGLPVAFINKEHLLQNKRASGRPKDLADLAELDNDKGHDEAGIRD
jgi:hypothetical protein